MRHRYPIHTTCSSSHKTTGITLINSTSPFGTGWPLSPAPINSSESRSARIVWKPYGFLEGISSQIKSESFTRSSCSHLEHLPKRPDFAYIIGDSEWKYHRPSPYGAIKAALLKNTVPSQMVTRQLLQVESQFRFAIPIFALSVLAKCWGCSLASASSNEPPALVIGVGTTIHRDSNGEASTATSGLCDLHVINWPLPRPRLLRRSQFSLGFLPILTEGLNATLDRLQKANMNISRVSLHVSHYERHETITAINSLLDKRKTSQPTPFEVLRLNHDSSFMVMDLNDTGYVAEEGTVVQLTKRHSLIVMEGRHVRPRGKVENRLLSRCNGSTPRTHPFR